MNGKKQDGRRPVTDPDFVVSTATRVGMGKPRGSRCGDLGRRCRCCVLDVVIGSDWASTAFVEAALAQLYKEKDPLYSGYHGGPAYYIHSYAERVRKKN